MTNYTKTMREALESMYVSEDNVGILRDIVKRKSAMPLKFADGKMKVDLFTASAVTQVLDKVNPANKTKLTKMINTGKKGSFIKIAQVVMKSENDPEVEEENEGFASDAQRRAAFASGYKEKGKKKKEEADLDEAMLIGRDYEYDEKEGVVKISKKNFRKVKKDSKGTIDQKNKPTMMVLTKKGTSLVPVKFTEEVEESYEVGTDEYAKHTREVTPGQEKEIDEARPSARRDAMRDMGKRGKDSADIDDYKATADDRKAASKNIIVQLRKAADLGGTHEVVFKDKKKVKVKPAIAMAFIKKFEKMKPADKAKLQDKGSKSYRDLLKGLKEEDTSMLGRIERKLKEIRNG